GLQGYAHLATAQLFTVRPTQQGWRSRACNSGTMPEGRIIMARKQVIPVPDLPAPTVPLSRVVRFGELVYVSGTGGRNMETTRWPGGPPGRSGGAGHLAVAVPRAAALSTGALPSVAPDLPGRRGPVRRGPAPAPESGSLHGGAGRQSRAGGTIDDGLSGSLS